MNKTRKVIWSRVHQISTRCHFPNPFDEKTRLCYKLDLLWEIDASLAYLCIGTPMLHLPNKILFSVCVFGTRGNVFLKTNRTQKHTVRHIEYTTLAISSEDPKPHFVGSPSVVSTLQLKRAHLENMSCTDSNTSGMWFASRLHFEWLGPL